jgi:hypothetical protein
MAHVPKVDRTVRWNDILGGVGQQNPRSRERGVRDGSARPKGQLRISYQDTYVHRPVRSFFIFLIF